MSDTIIIDRCPVCGDSGHLYMHIDHRIHSIEFDENGCVLSHDSSEIEDDQAISAIECTACDTLFDTAAGMFEAATKANAVKSDA